MTSRYILEYYAPLNIVFKEFLIIWGRAHVKCQGKKAHNTIYGENGSNFEKNMCKKKLVKERSKY